MNYVYIIVGLIIVAGGAYFFVQNDTDLETTDTTAQEEVLQDENIPEGMHRMPDGTLMQNEYMENMSSEDEAEMSAEMDMDVSVDLGGEAVSFDLKGFNFGYDVSEIRVKEGDTVTINLESTDGYHDWVVDEFGAATGRINTGDSASVTFVADKKGTYEFYCSVGSHRAQGMVGTLIVE